MRMPSSVIASMKYDPGLSQLRIRFVSGVVYNYKNVPEQVFKEMKAATSKGSFLNHHIKGKYQFEKIEHQS